MENMIIVCTEEESYQAQAYFGLKVALELAEVRFYYLKMHGFDT